MSRADGFETGSFETFSIGSDGVVSAVYSNGQMRPLAQIALATFENPGGLLKEGDNLFSQTTNSGRFSKGVLPTTEGTGKIAPGTLEMSNVDLSREFSDMIVTQRGFQANTRIITTSDEMLQELVNLKR
jgi:flagellar hook protein FlgE